MFVLFKNINLWVHHHHGDGNIPLIYDLNSISSFFIGHHESINEILQKDTEDESLRKYKEQLLGAAAKGVPKTDDPRRVVVETFGLKFPDGEHPDIIREVDTPEKVTKLENEPINIKEGVKYQFVVTYRVQHDIVPALHFVNTIKKTMVTVDQQVCCGCSII